MTQEESPLVLIADDGELEDVRRLLEELEIEFLDCWEGKRPASSLLVSTPHRALDPEASPSKACAASPPFHIVIADEISRETRKQLKQARCNFIVRRPAHPAALRLLILHALYRGPLRRLRGRVAMGATVKFRDGLRSRAATVVQLSERGCRLESSHAVRDGARISVHFPRELSGRSSLALEGRVVARNEAAGKCEFSLVFRPPDKACRDTLQEIMARNVVGSAALPPDRAKPATETKAEANPVRRRSVRMPRPREASKPEAASEAERRRSRRASYKRSVLAAGAGVARTVIGRDLSAGGMRVAPDSSLWVGDELKLAVYGRAGRKPLLVKAVIARDDGDAGCVLQFRNLAAAAVAELEKIVAALPSLKGWSPGSRPNVVISEIVED